MAHVTLLDGGMGQELIRRAGVAPTPLWSTQVMLDHPELVEQLHLDFIQSGAEIITLNNYTATPERLARDASIDLFKPIHAAAIEIAQAARAKSGKSVRISGCLPPIVASYKPDLAPDFEACLASYRELVAIQTPGVDLFFCETLSTIREAKAAIMAAKESGLPVWVSFTLDDAAPQNLRSGELLRDAVKSVADIQVDAVMVNCSMPETVTLAMPLLVEAFPCVGAYANGFQSVAPLKAGGTVAGLQKRQDLTPDKYADYAMNWVKMGATIIGGCCEVGPDHIAEIHHRLCH
ncbi:homocysteine S-methyltransferase family protein [Litorimonas sp. RW-G-Af-16]|uniref:homocysteine S-methyltransferase family protein n=1 Tax=Litorimonas sp. RW-G-Af-16 TaxID=3241168 RepID=UPI00390C74D0